jgi:hypothetical protein
MFAILAASALFGFAPVPYWKPPQCQGVRPVSRIAAAPVCLARQPQSMQQQLAAMALAALLTASPLEAALQPAFAADAAVAVLKPGDAGTKIVKGKVVKIEPTKEAPKPPPKSKAETPKKAQTPKKAEPAPAAAPEAADGDALQGSACFCVFCFQNACHACHPRMPPDRRPTHGMVKPTRIF